LLRHEYFEELAAVAALGELTPTQSRELSAHLAECADCRQALQEYEELHAPLHQSLDAKLEAIVDARKESIKTAILQQVAVRQAERLVQKQPDSVVRWRTPRVGWSLLAGAAAAAMAFWLGVRYERQVLAQSTERPAAIAMDVRAGEQNPLATSNLEPPRARNTTDPRYVELTGKLNAEQLRTASLEAALSKKDAEVTETQRQALGVQQQWETQKEETRRIEALLDAKTEQLRQLEAANAADSSTLVAVRYQVQDLTEKLNGQAESLERERQLLANGRDIRDIIGARNLHIIDVYDTDAGGKTRKSFARAFYTEGKSLVFYAYDLPTHGMEDGELVYAAWGEKNGNKNKVQKLGILLNDDKGQKRWALNFSDPKVLNEIDSVFVTLERVDMNGAEPKGKRMLTAYLDSQVNHP
jgi:Putative zinc-finger